MVNRIFVVGDLHGVYDEFQQLLTQISFNPSTDKMISAGDLVDRGPASDLVLKWFMEGKMKGYAAAVLGNHDDKLRRYLKGNKVSIRHGMQKTLDQIGKWRDAERMALYYFLEGLPLVYEDGHLIVTHAAYRPKATGTLARNLALYGEITGAKDDNGFPVRLDNWKKDLCTAHQCGALKTCPITKTVVHGHVVVTNAPEISTSGDGSKIYDVDGGCVFGGELVAVEFHQKLGVVKTHKVKANKVYCGEIYESES